MRNFCLLVSVVFSLVLVEGKAQDTGLQGSEAALAHANGMVERMGGASLWKNMTYVKFQHVWHPVNRESYVEDEIIDLVEIRSWVRMKSEVFDRTRAYSEAHGYWSLLNGELSQGNESSLENALKRGPYNIYRLLRAIANNSVDYELRIGESIVRGGTALDIYYKGEAGGTIVVNARNEPLVWETKQYKYTFGPLKKYGNLYHPAWAVYNNGAFTYEMVSLNGFNDALDAELFAPPG
ncbi:hypothetical protein [Spongiimicrobium sp. 2-473A-2-J]|uniref:hypothetical protein n=1 Tax=Eudoraea algarum TaxID=3417568 RepID=UPI003D3648F4